MARLMPLGAVHPISASLVKDALLGSRVLAGQPIEIWFQDEARVGQKGGHTYIWAEKDSRPLMVGGDP